MSSRWPMRLGSPLKNHTWLTGVASVMWPSRPRGTFARVTSRPHLSPMTPPCFIRLYLPPRHSQAGGGPQIFALGLEGPVVDRLRLGHLAVRPRLDLLGRGEADANRVEIARQGTTFVK